jgi:hypothetical protein
VVDALLDSLSVNTQFILREFLKTQHDSYL